ncbi:MAG: demethylmenaquinone methyltransferase [Pseudomonadota bacterium]|nr:MAG: demethylmenaquinone methyltransferase [Pseudomonadota bacterium]
MKNISQNQLETLRKYDTPTIVNSLELLDTKFRTSGFTTEQLVCADTSFPPNCRYARTATICASNEIDPQKKRERSLEYYKYVSSDTGPRVSVIQDIDQNPGFGAFWGEVNSNIHKALGVTGVLTNGSVGTLMYSRKGFPGTGRKNRSGPCLRRIEETGVPVSIFGMEVKHNDPLHADRHGAVVIPANLLQKLPEAIELMISREKVILDACKREDFDYQALRQAIMKSAEIH